MTRAEFAASIKAKYPRYADVPDDQLVTSMLAKYPQYASQVEEPSKGPSAGDMLSRNYPGGHGEVLTEDAPKSPGMLEKVTDAIRSAAHPSSLGDVLSLVIPTEIAPALKSFKGLRQFVSDAAAGATSKAGASRKVLGELWNAPIIEPAGAQRTMGTLNRKPLGSLVEEFTAESNPTRRRLSELTNEHPPIKPEPMPKTKPQGPPPRLAGKAPTLEDALKDALGEASESEPLKGSSRPDVTVTPGGRPSTTPDTGLRDLTDKLRKAETPKPITPTELPPSEVDWHSGAEAGTDEATQASALHKYEGEMDAGYRRRLADDRGEIDPLLLALLGSLGVAGATAHKGQ